MDRGKQPTIANKIQLPVHEFARFVASNIPANQGLLTIPGSLPGTGNVVLPGFVENALCVSCTDLAFFQISSKILVAPSFALLLNP